MDVRPDDLDTTRRAIAGLELVATASGYLTGDVAVQLPFEALTSFKTSLKQFFSSTEPWGPGDESVLSATVCPHLESGWWEHDLGAGITLAYGIKHDRFELWAGGSSAPVASIFDRAFDGPVVPEPTPHPRKVRFTTGGLPAPGRWYRRGDRDGPDDARVRRIFAEPDVTDVMVAGDFVTIGITATSPWERRLEPLLALVTELFADPATAHVPSLTREDLMQEAGHLASVTEEKELHLLDPDDDEHRRRLTAALAADDPKVRRVAVAVLAESDDLETSQAAVSAGFADRSSTVRRTAVDAAADTGSDGFRMLFEQALSDTDPWIRWRAVRAIGDLGLAPSATVVSALEADDEFRVRFEVARVLRNG